ncbi:MAG TPA: hypothetical protein VNM72_00415 [Blastocatellia bacterium]|nr:hypothetical protein [Blastocatellia bacterium]
MKIESRQELPIYSRLRPEAGTIPTEITDVTAGDFLTDESVRRRML